MLTWPCAARAPVRENGLEGGSTGASVPASPGGGAPDGKPDDARAAGGAASKPPPCDGTAPEGEEAEGAERDGAAVDAGDGEGEGEAGQPAKPVATLYVGNLPPQANEYHLTAIFFHFGPIQNIQARARTVPAVRVHRIGPVQSSPATSLAPGCL